MESWMKQFRGAVAILALSFVCLGAATPAAAQAVVTASELVSPSIHFQYAIYYLARPSKPPLAEFKAYLASRKHGPQWAGPDALKNPVKAQVTAYLETNVPEKYRVPTLSSLQYFGRSLTTAQAQALQNSRYALVIDFAHPRGVTLEALRSADELVEEFARGSGGLIWDEQTREVFSPDAWGKSRSESWSGSIPDVSKHITIHAYKNNELVRAITLGMAKFGLPDVVIENFSWSVNRNMGSLMAALTQALVEGQGIGKPGEFQLKLEALRHAGVRSDLVGSLKANASKVADLTLRQARPEQGDPNNRLMQVGFDRYPGPDVHARYTSLLASLWGAEDPVQRVRHNAELLEASRRAKAKIPELRAAFSKGLAPGEFIQVKIPFPIPTGGNEHMWVEIISWSGAKIGGMLKNQPVQIPGLRGGQMVEVNQDDIFDYLWTKPSGASEGNETAKILERMRTGSR
jgi:uncharacterized protein YegJ (DUF2314 family)